ncbi:cytochrome P450 [Streptomyces fuscichromogenes]|uniref:Cytochrome P450 n=1 Tax=Streptomyces fuscichromogenes TaxID=1324013 RepID=A0A918CT88_9ACTN|nr:cytochrome P450 [Streptomyces fuscichromogenes]GGN21149.1 cytochrome P450 [Streptomyces fuscichromogenes]
MTAQQSFTVSGPVRLWEDGFARNPHGYYAALRAQGPVGWAELAPGTPAYVVTERRAALDVLRDVETFSHDPRGWEATVPEDSPLLGMMRWRPNALFSDADAHLRYRTTLIDVFDLIEPHDLRQLVHRAVRLLVDRFGPKGEADLVTDFTRPLMALVFNNLFGLPDSQGDRLNEGLLKMMEGGAQAAAGEADFVEYVLRLIAAKVEERGEDLPSMLLDHPAQLTPEEVTWQVFLTLGAGYEPTTNLVSNALSRILGNPLYYSTLTSGARPVMDAVIEVLHHETPLANYGIYYARRPVSFHGAWIRPAIPVVVSFGAVGLFAEREDTGGRRAADASHLSWGAGPHACPVRHHALLIATEAIEQLTLWLPDLDPVLPRERLSWRPGPFHRSLTSLPVRFSPRSPDQPGETS